MQILTVTYNKPRLCAARMFYITWFKSFENKSFIAVQNRSIFYNRPTLFTLWCTLCLTRECFQHSHTCKKLGDGTLMVSKSCYSLSKQSLKALKRRIHKNTLIFFNNIALMCCFLRSFEGFLKLFFKSFSRALKSAREQSQSCTK